MDRSYLYDTFARAPLAFERGEGAWLISTNAFVVPLMAESTTIFGSPSLINPISACIRCGEPTEVPPNFIIFIMVY